VSHSLRTYSSKLVVEDVFSAHIGICEHHESPHSPVPIVQQQTLLDFFIELLLGGVPEGFEAGMLCFLGVAHVVAEVVLQVGFVENFALGSRREVGIVVLDTDSLGVSVVKHA